MKKIISTLVFLALFQVSFVFGLPARATLIPTVRASSALDFFDVIFIGEFLSLKELTSYDVFEPYLGEKTNMVSLHVKNIVKESFIGAQQGKVFEFIVSMPKLNFDNLKVEDYSQNELLSGLVSLTKGDDGSYYASGYEIVASDFSSDVNVIIVELREASKKAGEYKKLNSSNRLDSLNPVFLYGGVTLILAILFGYLIFKKKLQANYKK